MGLFFFVQQMGRLRRAGIPGVPGARQPRRRQQADAVLCRCRTTCTSSHPANPRPSSTIVWMLAVHGQLLRRKRPSPQTSRLGTPAAVLWVPGSTSACCIPAVNGREGHADYAPCRPGYARVQRLHEYWALGQVHHREILHQSPWVVFPGNVQGRVTCEKPGAKGASS